MTIAHQPVPPETVVGRVLLGNVSWETYEQLLAETDDRPIHLTYNRGLLEIETLSVRHEQIKKFVAQMIEAFAEFRRRPLLPVGSATWRQVRRRQGIEADESYYTIHAAQMADKSEIDLDRDPPPDLAVEVELSTSAVDKLAIYAGLGVGEVWRVGEESVELWSLTERGEYAKVDRSESFPELTRAALERLLRIRAERGHIDAMRLFRQELCGGSGAAA